MDYCSFWAETTFGPAVDLCRRPFDFTLHFEDIFFQLLPSCVFIVASTIRLGVIRKRPIVVRTGALHSAKLASLAVFSALKLAILVVASRNHGQTTGTSIPAAATSLVACVCLVTLSHCEHSRSHRPSFLISLYLVITSILRAAMVRTYWLTDPHSAQASLELAVLLVQIVLIVLEECSKRKYFVDQAAVISPEQTAGFLSRSCFTWLNRSFVRGYGRPLQMTDIVIDDSLASAKMATEFSRLQMCQNYGPLGLMGMAFRCLGLYGLAPIIPRLCMTGFLFAQPFLASSLISYLGGSDTTSKNTGYGLIGASLLVYGGIAVSTGWYWHLCYKCSTKIRGGIVEVIFAKMLRLKHEKGVEAKVLTLVIGDVHRITVISAFMHEFWAVPIEAAIGVWLLWRQVGPASLAVLAVAAVSTVGSIYIGNHIGSQQGRWLAATEKRLEATRAMLSSLKAIKMMSAGGKVGSAIEKLRVSEFAASKLFRSFLVASVMLSFATMTLAPVVVFGAYIGATGSSAEFDIARMFSSLILITLVASPLLSLLQVIPNLGAALGSAPRIVEFLLKEEIGAERDLPPTLPNKSASGSEAIKGELTLGLNEKGRTKEALAKSTVLSINDVSLGYDDRTVLHDVNLEVKKGKHIVITGPVGCGKSLLLEAILGEVAPKKGHVTLAPVSVGYCSQTAWLENTSVEENAFRFGVADNVWRNRVIDACALRELLESQARGTTVGSGGSQISGGEKQRLSLARAIAARPTILILDDAFSAIDRSTKRIICGRLFGPDGVVNEHGITVIQVTQDSDTAQFADVIFKIGENGQLAPFHFISRETEEGGEEKKADDETPTSENKIIEGGAVSIKDSEHEFADPASVRDRDVYRVYFTAIGFRHMATFILGTAAFAVALRFTDIWVRWWSEDATLAFPTRTTGYWLGMYAFLSVLPLVLISLGIAHLMHRIVPISGIGLHGKLLTTVLDATFVFISRIDSGSIINRFNQDLLLVDLKLPIDLLNTVTYIFVVTVQTILVVMAAIYLLAAIPVLAAVLWVLQHIYLRTSKRLRQLDLETKSGLQTKISESYQGIATLRAHGWQSNIRNEFWAKLDESQRPFYMLFIVQTWLQFVLNMVVAGLATTVAGVAVGTLGKISTGAIGIAFLNIVTLGEGLTYMIHSWTSLETSLGAIARIEAFEKDTPREKEVENQTELPPSWPSSGALVLDHVWASYYPERATATWSLQDVSVQIHPGERVAICGRSGSGKSTLLMALLGLVETPKGTIQLDGVDISRVPGDNLRRKYFVISQDAFLYGDSVREMLDPDQQYSDETIREALRDCAIEEKILECGGLSSLLKEVNLSVGQTQLFALARTILQAGATDGGVVLLDEATGSVDVETENRIMDIISRKLAGKTVVSVLHRLEAALQYDKILVMDKGQVAHFGTPAEIATESELFSH